MEKRLLEAIKKLGFASQDIVLKTARVFDSSERKQAKTALDSLIKSGEVVQTARGKVALAEKVGLVKGKLIGNQRGFAFVRPENGGEDLYVSERNLNGALHGDTVLARIERQNGRFGKRGAFAGKNSSCVVEQVIERGFRQVVGRFENRGVYCAVVPDDLRFAAEVFVQKENSMGATTGQKVVAEVVRYPEKRNDIAEVKVIEVLGEAGDKKVDTLSVVRSYGYQDAFPEEALKEAESVPTTLSPKDLEGRKDYRREVVFTIDGEDARDFDDAISLKKEQSGLYHLSVHIADVAHYVRPNMAIDKEAYRRGTSVYFPDYVIPMLPEKLCNEMCSLKPNEDRLTLSVEMDIDQKGNVVSHQVHEGVIRSAYRMTYTKVTAILKGDKKLREEYQTLVPMLEQMAELTKILVKRRDNMGQLDFDLAESQIVVNEKYETVDVRRKPRELADRLIEQFMLITNETVAKAFSKMGVPFVYRVHESPTQEGITRFVEFSSALGVKLPKLTCEASPKVLQGVLLSARGQAYETMVSKMMLRSMQKAVYFEKNMGHFGLACKDYCHFTSPIRRLPDLVIHRIIKMVLHGDLKRAGQLEEYVHQVSEQASVTEQKADEVERAVDDLKKAEWMSGKLNEEFDGVVSGVIETGVFVELENTVEGMIEKESLPEDHYYFEEKRVRLVGKQKVFALGDRVRVRVASVDVPRARINFVLAEEKNSKQNQKKAAKKAKNA